MKLVLIAFLASTFTISAFASSSDGLVRACERAGVEKVALQARSLGLKVKRQAIRECGVDNRPLNPWKYVWFCARTSGGEKVIRVITQKSAFSDCF